MPQPPPDDSVPNQSMTAPDANTTMGGPPAVARPAAPNWFANVSFGPNGFISQQASSYPLGNCPSSTDGSPVGPSQARLNNHTNYCFNDSRPTAVDTSHEPMAHMIMGGQVESPCPSDKERQVRNHKTSIYNIAGLALLAYHGNHYGVETLKIPFIHSCRYQSILPTAAEDVLLCYQDIQQVH
jgi:hypothetical protein